MKKTILFPVALSALIMSCSKESYRHQIAIEHPSAPSVVFADQTRDSVVFYTFDSYEVKSNNSDWITVLSSKNYPSSAKLDNLYYMFYRVPVFLEIAPNTTGKVRSGYVTIRSYGEDDWNTTAYAEYYQLYWHNITSPAPKYSYTDMDVTGVTYAATDSALQLTDTIRFTAHAPWTIEAATDSYITPKILSGQAGVQKIPLDIEPNATATKRETTITIKSDNGASTPITYTQEGRKAL